MGKFRLKHNVLSKQFDPNEAWPEEVKKWNPAAQPRDMSWGYIQTPNGILHVRAGAWIIKYTGGNYAVLNDEVFKATYEPADENEEPGDDTGGSNPPPGKDRGKP